MQTECGRAIAQVARQSKFLGISSPPPSAAALGVQPEGR